MTEDLKKYKLYFLQLKYTRIINIIHNVENHYMVLKQLNLLNGDKIIDFSNKIYNIVKNVNTIYNQHVNNYFNSYTEIDKLINSILNLSNTEILKILDYYESDISFNLFNDTIIIDLIKTYGYVNINDMLKILYPSINMQLHSCKNLLTELNNIVIPININIVSGVIDKGDYYWNIPTKYTDEDVLEKTRELYIKMGTDYICINLIFEIDYFSNRHKTSQNESPILHRIKTTLISKLEHIDINLLKAFIRHDYLGNIYCMDIDAYINIVNKFIIQTMKMSKSTFVNIMKDFISTDNIQHIYRIIVTLLLGSDDMIDIAGLLLGLIKDKNTKINNASIYDYIFNNLTFHLQSKIKKSNINIKQSLNKLKQITIDEVDYKKLLVINKYIPNHVKSQVLDKIEEMKSVNNEYYKQLLYVKTILYYPWGSSNDELYENLQKDNNAAMTYLNTVETKLQNTCYGHADAKKLLLQVIAKWISNPSSNGTCFGLVGPPGVGKTLLAKSVSEALDIPFAQITLGGQNDGELLHGHGYTYSGSQPGLIIKKMVEMGKSRCIIYFDELDKTCSKHGSLNEITSILIHLTDPNMNKTFQDRFFQGIEFPLDKVIMIFSYNDSSLVDPILLDRLKEIKVLPYTIEDKLNICQKHLIKEIANSVSMNVTINNTNLQYIIDNYTNEAGVREIKRQLENIFMNLNIDRIYKRNLFKKDVKKISLTQKHILNILKAPDMNRRDIHVNNMVGIINGMYATSSGDGGITPIQIYPNTQTNNNKYEIKMTGKQGDTMKESVICSLTTALEWLKIKGYKVDELIMQNVKNGFHVHTPDGATSKDGPSAGCAFTCAFISRILNRPIKNNIAMTGEIELTGKVSKIGGLEYKLQGAKKSGVNIAYVPLENKKDIDDIIKKYKLLFCKDFQVKMFSSIDEIIEEILCQ